MRSDCKFLGTLGTLLYSIAKGDTSSLDVDGVVYADTNAPTGTVSSSSVTREVGNKLHKDRLLEYIVIIIVKRKTA